MLKGKGRNAPSPLACSFFVPDFCALQHICCAATKRVDFIKLISRLEVVMKILALEEKVMSALLEAAYAQFIRMEANGVVLTHEEKRASTAAILTLADLRHAQLMKGE